jgi:tRNA(Ile)-lysidine synthetase-like protein
VIAYAEKNTLWQPGHRLLLAVSGGPDSVCLLTLMTRIAQKEGISLAVAHVNYRLRGNDSERDAQFVESLARELNLPFFLITRKKGVGHDENTLRNFRYHFFDRLLSDEGFDSVVLGHHADDQVETFFLRLLRGAGNQGLGAMLPKDGSRIRPLLFLWKKDILKYLKMHSLSYCTDITNAELFYLRNKIRHNLLPYLENGYQPNIKKIIYRTAEILNQASHPSPRLVTLGILETPTSKSFSADVFLTLTPHEQSLFFRTLMKSFLSQPISHRLYQEVLKTISSTKNKTKTLSFHGLKLTKKGATVSLQKVISD